MPTTEPKDYELKLKMRRSTTVNMLEIRSHLPQQGRRARRQQTAAARQGWPAGS